MEPPPDVDGADDAGAEEELVDEDELSFELEEELSFDVEEEAPSEALALLRLSVR